MHLLSSPRIIFDVIDLRLALDLHLLFALRSENLTSVSSTFLPVVLDQFFIRMSAIEPLVYDALRTGSVGAIALSLPPYVRNALDRELAGPNPERARQIRSAIEPRNGSSVPLIWPHLRYIRCLSSASFSIGRATLKNYVGEVPIMSPVYSASETFLGFSLQPDLDPTYYVIATEDAFVEFLPERDRPSDDTCLMTEVTVGAIYQIIVTTYAGLYRYRLGDRVRVVGFWGQAPIVELLGRVGQALNIFGEKTPEDALIAAVQDMAAARELTVVDFVATIAWGPARYVIYTELFPTLSVPTLRDLAATLDSALRQRNPDYDDFRVDGSLASAEVRIVQKGMIKMLVDVPGSAVPSLQQKRQRIVHSAAIASALDSAAQQKGV